MTTKSLVIVESPSKAKTISKYLGKDFVVKSSVGHVRRLTKGNKAINLDDWSISYEIDPKKEKVVKDLKSSARGVENIFLATDLDREGEAIAWHLKEILDLDDNEYERIIFREITKNAILKSLENPTKIDMNLVNAQQARRVLDRLVGFEISPILWKKIKRGLSAGRVQSVAVKFVVDRENEINNFEAKSSFKTIANFISVSDENFTAELDKRFETIDEARKFLKDCSNKDFIVSKVEKKPSKRSPSAPFTTSTLQQEASRKIGFSPSLTMSTAQRLYEAGHITSVSYTHLTLPTKA